MMGMESTILNVLQLFQERFCFILKIVSGFYSHFITFLSYHGCTANPKLRRLFWRV